MLKGKTKRLLSFLLSVAIVLSLFTMNISAAESNVASIGDTYYNSVADALSAAVSGDTVIVQKDTTIKENVEIKAGVTLLLPYKAGYTGYSLSGGTPDTSTSQKSITDTLYRTLTVAEGVTMTVNGNILVSAMLGVAHGGSFRQEVNGAYAQIILNGKMNVQSGGIVCANGYIKGTGAIEAFPGGEVRDLFVFEHWRGGSHASGMAYGEKVWVANEYDFRNIEVEVTIHYGAKLVAQNIMYFDNGYNHSVIPFVSGSEGVFILNEGGKIVRTVEHRDRIGKKAEVYKLYGGGYIGSIKLTIKVTNLNIPFNFNSADYVLSMDGDNEVHLYSGTLSTVYKDKAMSLKLLPGCEFIIHEGAGLSVDRYKKSIYNRPATFVAYRELTDENFSAAYRYPQGRPSAKIRVLNGGQLYVDGILGGEIHLEENATVTKGNNAEFTAETYEAVKLKEGDKQLYTNEAEFIVPKEYHVTGWVNNQLTWEKHTYSETAVVDPAPTCTEKGVNKFICTYDGCNAYISNEIPATGHSYTTEKFMPDCENDGYILHTCTSCGDTYTTDVISAYGHTVVVDEAVAPGCLDDGLTEGAHCSVCEKVLVAQETVEAHGHKYETVTVAPTCTESGYDTHTCSVCGHSYTDSYTDSTGHSEVIDSFAEPTCTETGLTEGKHCETCGEIFVAQEIIPATGHNYKETVIEPKCTEDGYTNGLCLTCGDEYKTNFVPALTHAEVIDEAVEPTCTETGLTEGKHCERCGEIFIAQEIIPASGHEEEEEFVEATCTEDGYKKIWCSVCDEILLYEDYKAGHKIEITEVPPTDYDYGYTRYYCYVCGYERIENTGDPLIKRYEITGSVISTSKTVDDSTTKILLISAEDSNVSYTTEINGTEEYKFEKLLPGKYIMIVTKPDHATFEQEVVLGEEDFDLGEVKINLKGDVSGEGVVNAIDVARANGHAKGAKALTGYEKACADVNGDGKINAIDVARINAHAKGTKALW